MLMSKGLGANGVTAFVEANARYFINQQQDLIDFQKVIFMDIPEISQSLLCVFFWVKKSQTIKEPVPNEITSHSTVLQLKKYQQTYKKVCKYI